jgi:uncharacterized protein YqjF (DUF2071 family)
MPTSPLLAATAHRPWSLPTGPWIMRQTWHDLLFAHWPIPVEVMRPLVPPQLALDTFDGMAWVGVVPFGMQAVTPRLVTPLPWLSAFPELNVRTYVRAPGPVTDDPAQDKPGVYFFSLDAANSVAVQVARQWFKLPYYHAAMRLLETTQPDPAQPAAEHAPTIDYTSRRTHRGATPAEFQGSYAPTGAVYAARPKTLEHWLTERYALYTMDKNGRSLRGEIHHLPWPLQPAAADIRINSMAAAAHIPLPDIPPLLHFARRLDVLVWPLRMTGERQTHA